MADEPVPLPLFRRYPALEGSLPRNPILGGPSPVERLEKLERVIGSPVPLWIKRDDRLPAVYGGNKPRKLEFLLGRGSARGIRSVVTVGGLGSNHCLATAIYGRQAGLVVHACLVDQPVTPSVRRTLGSMATLGARLHYAGSGRRVRATILRLLAQETLRSPLGPPLLIPPGGSVPLGTIGIVNAALELAEQAEAGRAPRPGAIFVALGSGGTQAGIAAGMRLLGWDVPVVGVRVSDKLPLEPYHVARLAGRTLRAIQRADPSVPRVAIAADDIVVQEGYMGEGYGYPTREGRTAAEMLEDAEGITMEGTYTGKAMAAMLAAAREGRFDGPLLFWHTFNTRAFPPPAPGWEAALPAALRRTLEREP